MDIDESTETGRSRVWLSKSELERLYEQAEDDMRKEIALRLMGDCGLRSAEVLDVKYEHIEEVEDSDRYLLYIPNGKGEKSRKTIISSGLRESMKALNQAYQLDGQPLVDVSKRTLTNWLKSATEDLDGDGWNKVSCHDLRRSFGTNLLGAGVSVPVAMEVGGWDDWPTFKKHYVGKIQGSEIAEQTAGFFS
jgi:integrase